MRQLLRERLAPRQARDEAGFTLTELLVVMAVIGVLISIALPAYLSNQARARESTAQANLRSAVPAIELYFSEHHTYVGISHAALTTNYGAGIAPVTFPTATASTYCVESTYDSRTFSKSGPDAPIIAGSCGKKG